MNCKYCGAYISSESTFCPSCGKAFSLSLDKDVTTPSSDLLSPSKKSGVSLTDDIFSSGTTPPSPPSKKGGSLKKKLFIAGGVLLALLALLLLTHFPLKVTFDSEPINTATGIVEEYSIGIKSNQPITDVYYSLSPKDSKNLKEYTKIKSSGLYKRNVSLNELKVPPGETKMYVCVTTIFGGKAFHEIDVNFNMGSISAPQRGKIITLDDGIRVVSNELIIIAKEGTTPEEIESLVSGMGGTVVGSINPINNYQVRFTGSGESYLESKINQLKSAAIVENVIHNSIIEGNIEVFPGDSQYDSWTSDKTNPDGNNWSHECIDAPTAWNYNNRMSTVKVGIIDSFVDINHEDLLLEESKFFYLPTDSFPTWQDYKDFLDSAESRHSCSNPSTCTFCSGFQHHGVHVSGIVGAVGDNGRGVCGVNWNSDINFINFWYLEQTASDNYETLSTTLSLNMTVSHCILSGCRVMNISIGDTMPSLVTTQEMEYIEAFDNMISFYEQKGYDFLICKSAGNESDDAENYMMNRILTYGENSRAHSIIVGAIGNHTRKYSGSSDTFFEKAVYSNYGDIVDIMAPGSDVYSTICDDEYAYMNGTSMATPVVTGVVSLIYSLNPTLTYDQVKTLVTCLHDSWCYYDGKAYPVVDAGKATKYVVDNGFTDISPSTPATPEFGYVNGTVQDAVTEEILVDAEVKCIAEDGTVYTSDVRMGIYQCQLPKGTYNMEFSCEGYLTETVYGVDVQTDVVTYNMLLNMVMESSEEGSASGRIIDAFDAASIPNASIKFYRGINSTSGSPVYSTTADSDGYYEVTLEAGNYTLVATASGYEEGSANILIIPDMDIEEQNCSVIPILNPGEIRVVLTWGHTPDDLDSHMVGPAPSGRFHTYYSDMDYISDGTTYCALDVDDTSSYGPETTSVYVGLNGTYTYYVHDFTNKGSGLSSVMARSGAQVKVYVAGESAPKIFNVPNVSGTLWKVCSIKNGDITPINEVSYHENPQSVGNSVSVN